MHSPTPLHNYRKVEVVRELHLSCPTSAHNRENKNNLYRTVFNQVLIFPRMEILQHLSDPFLYLINFRVENYLNQNFPRNSSCPLPVSRNHQRQSGFVSLLPYQAYIRIDENIPFSKSSWSSSVQSILVEREKCSTPSSISLVLH